MVLRVRRHTKLYVMACVLKGGKHIPCTMYPVPREKSSLEIQLTFLIA